MRSTINRVKALVIGLAAVLLIATIWWAPATVPARAAPVAATDEATTALYTGKCKMCHGDKAQKLFDAALTDEQMVDAIMNGKKGAKPPNMPAFAAKGITAEQAKALVDYMRSIKAPA